MSRRRSLAAVLLTFLAVLLVACGATAQPGSGPATDEFRGAYGLNSGPGGVAVGAPAPAAQPEKADGSTGNTVPVPQVFGGERKLILTGNVSLRAGDPWAVSDRVQLIAAGVGGEVMGLSQSGTSDQRQAMLTIRVPQERFNDALRQIRDIADIEVLSSSVEGQDVTDQFVDLEARLKAKVAEEQRYMALLARAESIEDILRIDQVLAQVRTQIEQLTGQLNSIKARTTFSTITVSVIPLLAEPKTDPGAYDPSRTLERAFAALASLMRVAADALIWALVFGWLPLTLLGLAMLVARTRSRITPAA
jgi:hypothetical protein